MQTTAHETIKESPGIKSRQENVITIKKQTVIGNGEKNPVDNNAKEKSLYVMKGTKSESRRWKKECRRTMYIGEWYRHRNQIDTS